LARLITFGDSYTQGTGLSEDMLGPKLDKASPIAWPQLTADLLGIKCVNKGLGGIGCKMIAYMVSKFDFLPSDIVVIMWPDRARWCVLPDSRDVEQDKIHHITPREIDCMPQATAFYNNLYSDRDVNFMFDAWSTYADTICKSQANRVIHTVCDAGGIMPSYRKINPRVEWVHGFKESEDDRLDSALDGHWGPIAHQDLSKRLSEYIALTEVSLRT